MAEQKNKYDNILSLFDRFDNSVCSKVISDRTLMRISHNPNWNETLVYKISLIKKYVSLIQKQANIKYSSALGKKFSIEKNMVFYADPNMPNVFVKLRIMNNSKSDILPLSLNIPLDKLITMPSLEVYAILSAATNDVIQKSLAGKTGYVSDIDLAKADTKTQDLTEKKDTIISNDSKKHAEIILSKYLETFLPNYFGDEFKEFDDISKLVAAQIVGELSDEQIQEMMGMFFDFSKFDNISIEKVASFTGKDLSDIRCSKLFSNAQELWMNPDKEPEALNATQQYQELMSTSLKGEFKNIIQNGNLNNGFNIEKFCINYADTFMASNGLKPIKLTFKNQGDLGEYLDGGGTNQCININLQKISSVTELVSTLSHELTHAVESSMNKSTGKETEQGFGLVDNISNDISGATDELKTFKLNSRNMTAYQFLQELNRICYHINPNERSARYGELSALKFMSAITGNQKSEEQLSQTVESFKIYQQRTLDIINNLKNPKFLNELQASVDEITSSNVSQFNKEFFITRMQYLKEMLKKEKTLNSALEEESIREVEKQIKKGKVEESVLSQEIDELLSQPGM